MMKKILVLHGPNLNRLGLREPAIYGLTTLNELNESLQQQASLANCVVTCFQSNSEGELIDAIHQAASDEIDYLIINPAALTHTSIALRDAVMSVPIPFYEVHISNIFGRDTFRHHSYLSDIAQGIITGFGVKGYSLTLQVILEKFNQESF
jgi:3-dehydroquinate dehydratase-2